MTDPHPSHSDTVGPVLVPDDDAEDLYERAPCGYLSTTRTGTIVRVNQTLLDWLGLEQEDLLGKPFTDLLSAGGRIYHETHYRPMLSLHGTVREIALDFVRKDASRLPVLVNSRVVVPSDGGEEVIRTSILDATHRREYEQELLRARRRAEASEARSAELARTLQSSLIPPNLPVIDGVELGATYRPAGDGAQVGGDFYDVFETDRHDWIVVVGDVRGKGARAATITALVRYSVRAAAIRQHRPSRILADLNAVLLHHETERFCTVVCCRVRLEDDGTVRVTMASGGHPPAVFVGPETAEPVDVTGTLIGVVDEPSLTDVEIRLGPGEGLFCYTDGLTEARRGREMLGMEGLLDLLFTHRALPASELTDAVVTDVMTYQGSRPRDDIAAVHIRVPDLGAPLPHASAVEGRSGEAGEPGE